MALRDRGRFIVIVLHANSETDMLSATSAAVVRGTRAECDAVLEQIHAESPTTGAKVMPYVEVEPADAPVELLFAF